MDFNCWSEAARFNTSWTITDIAAWRASTGHDGGSVVADASFVDAGSGDYALAGECAGVGREGASAGGAAIDPGAFGGPVMPGPR